MVSREAVTTMQRERPIEPEEPEEPRRTCPTRERRKRTHYQAANPKPILYIISKKLLEIGGKMMWHPLTDPTLFILPWHGPGIKPFCLLLLNQFINPCLRGKTSYCNKRITFCILNINTLSLTFAYIHSDLKYPITFGNSKMIKFQIFNFFLL